MITPGVAASLGYDVNWSDEALYGTAGWMTAHEISHAFDYYGAQFDAWGKGSSVLAEEDVNKYLALVDGLASYLDSFEMLPGVNLSGQRVKTEASADITGMQIALAAAKNIPGFRYEEFFVTASHYMFMSFPAAENVRYILSDEHPLHYVRVNASAQMTQAFYDTYGASENSGMYLPEEKRIRFWGK